MKIKSGRNKIAGANNFVQQVEKKAYELYKKRGCEHGCDWNDWFAAERQVEAETDILEKDCIRSENFYKASHRSIPLPSGIDEQKINTNLFLKDS